MERETVRSGQTDTAWTFFGGLEVPKAYAVNRLHGEEKGTKES